MKITEMVSTEEASVEPLERMLECIALESGFLGNMVDRIRDVLPSFATDLKESIGSLVGFSSSTDETGQRLNKLQRDALAAVDRLQFVSFSERIVNVPEGFKGKYIPYAQTLVKIVNEVYKAQLTVIPEYTKLLSQFLTNKDDKISLKDHTNFYRQVAKEVKDYQETLDLYKGNASRTKLRMKDVISRFADLKELFHLVNVLTDSQSRAQLTHIRDEVQHCVDLLDLIIDGIQKKTITNISPEAGNNIATGAFEIGRYVRFISQVYFTVEVFLNLTEQLTKSIAQHNH